MIETYEAALAFIHGRTQFKKSDQLRRMNAFMDRLGNPQRDLSIIHVAGTNGKGSTVAFLQNLLVANGHTVGTFTSPFLMRFNERISINGEPISDADLLTLINVVKPVVNELDASYPEGGPTEFEIITAMMFVYFKGRVDVAIVEVGIGGLLDSTNVLTPAVAVITTIGYDHMRLLGDTLPKIAAQKAGIIKPKVPVVIGQLPAAAKQVIQQTAQRQAAPLYQPDSSYHTRLKPSAGWQERFDYEFNDVRYPDLQIQLLGDYQVANASSALTAFLVYETQMQQKVQERTVKQALKETKWPGRFEAVVDDPLIVLDGAHNQPAMSELTRLVNARFSDREVYVLFAVLADKQFEKMLAILLQIKHVHLVLTTFNGPGHRVVESPESLAKQYGDDSRIRVVEDWQLGIAQILRTMSADDLFLITGSLYFISDVRHFFKDES